MNISVRNIVPALLLACSTCLPSFSADMTMQGATYVPRSQYYAKAEWHNDTAHSGQRLIRLSSESPILERATSAALMLTPDDSTGGGSTLEKVTFEVNFNKQAHRNVKPDIVIDWLECNPVSGEKKERRSRLKFDQVKTGDGSNGRIKCGFDVRDVFNVPAGINYQVRRITIGGREIEQSGFNCFMDIAICDVKIFTHTGRGPGDLTTNTEILQVKDSSGIYLRDLMIELVGEPL